MLAQQRSGTSRLWMWAIILCIILAVYLIFSSNSEESTSNSLAAMVSSYSASNTDSVKKLISLNENSIEVSQQAQRQLSEKLDAVEDNTDKILTSCAKGDAIMDSLSAVRKSCSTTQQPSDSSANSAEIVAAVTKANDAAAKSVGAEVGSLSEKLDEVLRSVQSMASKASDVQAAGGEREKELERELKTAKDEVKKLEKKVEDIREASAKECASQGDASSNALTTENEQLKDKVSHLEQQLVDAKKAASSSASSGALSAAVQSCKGYKPKYTRPMPDPRTGKLPPSTTERCPFVPENYDNWPGMPDLCQYINIECEGKHPVDGRVLSSTHLFGYGWSDFMMSHADLMMLEFIFGRHSDLKDVIELGTSAAVTTLYMGVMSRTRSGELHTFDINDKRSDRVTRAWQPNMHFYQESVLRQNNLNVIKVMTKTFRQPYFALFDNGDKTEEVNRYCRYMPVGSVLIVHDWQNLDLPRPHYEIDYPGIATELERRGFEKRYFDFADHLGSGVRVFVRVSAGAGVETEPPADL